MMDQESSLSLQLGSYLPAMGIKLSVTAYVAPALASLIGEDVPKEIYQQPN